MCQTIWLFIGVGGGSILAPTAWVLIRNVQVAGQRADGDWAQTYDGIWRFALAPLTLTAVALPAGITCGNWAAVSYVGGLILTLALSVLFFFALMLRRELPKWD